MFNNKKCFTTLLILLVFSASLQAEAAISEQYFAGKFAILSKFGLSKNHLIKKQTAKILFGKGDFDIALKNDDNCIIKKDAPIPWYVAGSEEDDSVILFSEYPLVSCKFQNKSDGSQDTNSYKISNLRQEMQNLFENKFKKMFTPSELSMVQDSIIKTNSYTNYANITNVSQYSTIEKFYVPCSKNDVRGKNSSIFVGENLDFPIDISLIKKTIWLRSPYKYRNSDVLVADCNEGIYDYYADSLNFSHVAFKLNLSDVLFASSVPPNFEGKILLEDKPLVLRLKSVKKNDLNLVDNHCIEVKNSVGSTLVIQWCENDGKNFCFCKKIENLNETFNVNELLSRDVKDFNNCKIWLEYNSDNMCYVTNVINLENEIKTNCNIHFCTYGNDKFENSKIRLSREALDTGVFKSINVFSPENLSIDFKNKYQNLLLRKKGNGFWLWKLDVLDQMLKKVPEGDYVFYLDAGSTLKKEFKNQMLDWVSLLENSEYKNLSLFLSNLEKEWTIKEIFFALEKLDENYDKFNVENTEQISATCLLLKNDEHSRKILDTCFKLIDYDNNLITGDYNDVQNCYFKDSRYDQSILSCVRKDLGTTRFPNKLKKYIEFSRIRN